MTFKKKDKKKQCDFSESNLLKDCILDHHIMWICTKFFLFKSVYTPQIQIWWCFSSLPVGPSPICDLIKSGWNWDETCKMYSLSRHYRRFQFNSFKFLRILVHLQCRVWHVRVLIIGFTATGAVTLEGKKTFLQTNGRLIFIGPICLKRERCTSRNSGFQS